MVIIKSSYTTVRGKRNTANTPIHRIIYSLVKSAGYKGKAKILTRRAFFLPAPMEKKQNIILQYKGVLMNEYQNIMKMERCRTLDYAMSIPDLPMHACPVCGSVRWDYLLKDKSGDFVGCDDCLSKIYS